MWIFIKNIRSAFILFICFDISNSNKVRNFWDAIGKRIENERNRWLVYAISLLLDAILNLSSNFMFARAKILRCVFDVLGKLLINWSIEILFLFTTSCRHTRTRHKKAFVLKSQMNWGCWIINKLCYFFARLQRLLSAFEYFKHYLILSLCLSSQKQIQ